MRQESKLEPSRVVVWEAMAEHFLDTETRPQIPRTALCCVAHGLTIPAARDVWRFEVTPALWHNLWNPAGVWDGWSPRWLVERITAKRRSWLRRLRWLDAVCYRVSASDQDSYWRAMERVMQLLQDQPATEHGAIVSQLEWLAGHYFDVSSSSPCQRIVATGPVAALFDGGGRRILESLVVPAFGESREAGEQRVRSALQASAEA